MKLNIGAGGRKYPGWTSVDLNPIADVVSDALKIDLPDQCADEVMAIHLLEHLHVWDAPLALHEWFRLLKHKGKLTLEMPDIVKVCRNIHEGFTLHGKHPDQMGMWGAYGDPREQNPLMTHKWGWTFKTLAPVIKEVGFVKVTEHPTQFHPCGRERRDFRLEAIKP